MNSNGNSSDGVMKQLAQIAVTFALAAVFSLLLWFTREPGLIVLCFSLGIWLVTFFMIAVRSRRMIGDPPVAGVIRLNCGLTLMILGMIGEVLLSLINPAGEGIPAATRFLALLPPFMHIFGLALMAWGLVHWIIEFVRVKEIIQDFNSELVEEFREVDEANFFLKSLMKASPFGIITLDMANRVIHFNDHAAMLLRAEGESLDELPVGELFGEENRKGVEEALEEVFLRQRQVQLKIWFRADEDDPRMFETFLAPVYGRSRVETALMIMRDNTDEELRQEKEAEFARELESHDKRVRTDIELARRYQRNLVREDFTQHRMRAISLFEPNFHLSGDFYSVFELDEQHFGLIIGDVSSKGLAAAVRAIAVLTLCRNYAPLALQPGWLLEQLSAMFLEQESETDRFCTIFYMKADSRKCVVEYARAGHELPIWYHAETNDATLVEEGGVVAGMVEGQKYDTFEMRLDTGDKLVFYTDGIIDVKNEEGDRWKKEGLLPVVSKFGHLPPERLRETIIREANRFSGDAPYNDDVTLVILEVVS